jgi:two-component system sensor histidine kinase GlrK
MAISRKKISIGTRILLGTIVNILVMLGLAGFTIYNVGKFHDLTGTIVEGNYKIITSAKIIGKLIANMSEKDEKILYLDRSALEQDSTFQEIFNSNKEEVEKHIDKLGKLVKTPQERETLEEIRSNFFGFCENFYTKIKSIKLDNPEVSSNARELSDSQTKLVGSMQEAIKSIIKGNDKTIEEKLNQLDDLERMTKNAEYWVVLSTLFFFIVFGYFLYSRIRKPIEILKNGTRSIFHGKLGAQIEIHSGDEFEELALAFNKMSKKVKKVDAMKSEFIHVVTHELRTPLTSMKEANSLIKEKALGPVTPNQAKFLDITEQGINRLIKFIDELLELSKVESGLYKVKKKSENLIELISENLLHLQCLIEEKNINVIKNFHVNLPNVELDSLMISRVMTNLLSNAIKHTPQYGELSVEAVLSRWGKNGSDTTFGNLVDNIPVVEVSVSDSGGGIENKNWSDVFSKFYQVSKPKEAKANGSGLGLAISKEIILAHKGIIGVGSELGKGTRFFFALPVNPNEYVKTVFSEF